MHAAKPLSAFILSLILAVPQAFAGDPQPGGIVPEALLKARGSAAFFRSGPISDAVFKRINGKSWKDACRHDRKDFRYVTALHHDGHGSVRLGEMILHKDAAEDVLDILAALYVNGRTIEKMVLIDLYDADDERSMTANNSSAFNCRVVKGSKKLSAHAMGLAVDLNPLWNPYVKDTAAGTIVQPEAGRPFADRSRKDPRFFDKDDLAVTLFKDRGWIWGGDWKSLKDWQHFEKPMKRK